MAFVSARGIEFTCVGSKSYCMSLASTLRALLIAWISVVFGYAQYAQERAAYAPSKFENECSAAAGPVHRAPSGT